MVERICGNHVQVDVRNLKPRDDERGSLAAERSDLSVSYSVGKGDEVVCHFDRKVGPSVNFDTRDDEDMSGVDRIDRHDRNG